MQKIAVVTAVLAGLLSLGACKGRDELQRDLDVAKFELAMYDQRAEQQKPICPELSNLPTNRYITECARVVREQEQEVARLERKLR